MEEEGTRAFPGLELGKGQRTPMERLLWAALTPPPGPQAEIFQAFTELFQAACAKPPPQGLCDYPSSRAVYAIDLMLKWDSRPDGEGPHPPNLSLTPSRLPEGASLARAAGSSFAWRSGPEGAHR